MKSSSMNDLPMIMIKENEDGSFTLEWDETDPRCQEFNDWTHDDWVKAIEEGLAKF